MPINSTPPATLVTFGSFTINFYGLLFALAVLAAYRVSVRLARRQDVSEELVENLYFYGLPISILGARLYHVIDLWDFYRANPGLIPAVWQGGLGIYGGIVAGVLFIIYYARRHGVTAYKLLDILLPSLALGQAIGRWGNYFNQEAFGPPTELPWAIPIEPRFRPERWLEETHFHPVFLYESILNLISFVVLYYIFKRTKKHGIVTGLYFVNYGLIRFVVEFLRWDTWMIGAIKVAHLVSLSAVLIGFLIMLRRKALSMSDIE